MSHLFVNLSHLSLAWPREPVRFGSGSRFGTETRIICCLFVLVLISLDSIVLYKRRDRFCWRDCCGCGPFLVKKPTNYWRPTPLCLGVSPLLSRKSAWPRSFSKCIHFWYFTAGVNSLILPLLEIKHLFFKPDDRGLLPGGLVQPLLGLAVLRLGLGSVQPNNTEPRLLLHLGRKFWQAVIIALWWRLPGGCCGRGRGPWWRPRRRSRLRTWGRSGGSSGWWKRSLWRSADWRVSWALSWCRFNTGGSDPEEGKLIVRLPLFIQICWPTLLK